MVGYAVCLPGVSVCGEVCHTHTQPLVSWTSPAAAEGEVNAASRSHPEVTLTQLSTGPAVHNTCTTIPTSNPLRIWPEECAMF